MAELAYNECGGLKVNTGGRQLTIPDVSNSEAAVCKCKGGPTGRTVTADFEHQICDTCGKIAN